MEFDASGPNLVVGLLAVGPVDRLQESVVVANWAASRAMLWGVADGNVQRGWEWVVTVMCGDIVNNGVGSGQLIVSGYKKVALSGGVGWSEEKKKQQKNNQNKKNSTLPIGLDDVVHCSYGRSTIVLSLPSSDPISLSSSSACLL